MSPERSTWFLLPVVVEGWLCLSKSQVTFMGKWQNTLENTQAKCQEPGTTEGYPGPESVGIS